MQDIYYIMHFPETDYNQLTGILYDLVYLLVFLGSTWKDWGAVVIKRELKGFTLVGIRVGSIKTKPLHCSGLLSLLIYFL